MDSDSLHSAELTPRPIILHKNDFEALYREYWQRLYDFALCKTHDKDVAEEIVQDLFVNIWEKRKELHVFNVQSYLFVSVRNKVINYYKQKVFADLDTANDTVAPDYPLFLEELEAALQGAMGQLPQKTHDIFLLNRFEGKSAREIAAKLHIPERTVEYHITQALRQLKVLLRNSTTLLLAFISSITF
ncbi:RNA polymerase sigma-70 factor [Dyadobacter fanqingshengii]|uniref:RNA polymerase sigma-70 factor n=1 Tax=Dyadobacter fanqingshengii TaxID=2906443 RepID=A0A9X1TAD3_9BACT|nr:RNA polymerase sigma-70 factor [Dyadobacter fanqingshengii]MCF0041343.1 RNA polymerase sigma-70 factor [Dyadobacter fanqingshengii]MCF2505552.1 RNA polymerase sigma-70 factor [Dyadobacter fanqingshengii]USJ36934.1 RNA polymerase sigma-70 factor [Dyadobacter fanqingshengii]